MREIKKPKKKATKINPKATENSYSTNDDFCRFVFSFTCERHCLLSDWQKIELSELIGFFKKLELQTWKDIFKDDGLNYESHSWIALPRPRALPPDASLDSMRVTQRMRLYGYRTQNFFNIIWFDREHKVCPTDKECKYRVG